MNRVALTKAIKVLSPCVDKSINALGTHCICFDSESIAAHNQLIGCIYPITTPLNHALDGKILTGILSGLTGDEVSFEFSEAVSVRCGKTIATVPHYDVSLMKRIKDILFSDLIWRELPKDYTQLLLRGALPSADMFPGVFVDGCDIYSTNQQIIYHAKAEMNLEPHLIPIRVLPELAKHSFDYCAVGKKWIFFKNKEYTWFVSSLEHHTFPVLKLKEITNSYENVGNIVEGYVPDIGFAVKACELTGSDKLKLHFNMENLTIETKGIVGKYYTEVECNYNLQEPFTCELTSRMLKWVLKQGVDNVVISNGVQGTGVSFKQGETSYLVHL